MGKTAVLFAQALPRLGAGTVYSADSGFQTDIEARLTPEQRVYVEDLLEYVPKDVALLRTWVLGQASRSFGVGVEQFSFRLHRFCVVEPSYVVVLVPILDGVPLEDFLMPLTKREKQLMLTAGTGDFPDPAVASAGKERILPFVRITGLSGSRFLRHAGGHVAVEVEEEVKVDEQGNRVSWWTVTKVVTGGYLLYLFYILIQVFAALCSIGLVDLLTGEPDPALSPWNFIFRSLRRGALFSYYAIDGFVFPSATIDVYDWVAIKEALQRAYSLLSCKLVGGCLVSVVQWYDPEAGPMPFASDVLSVASSFAVTRYVAPGLVKLHYIGTMVVAEKLWRVLPSLPSAPGLVLPSLQRMLFGTFFYAALCAGEIDMTVFKPLNGKVTWGLLCRETRGKCYPASCGARHEV